MTGIMSKWPSSKRVTETARAAPLLMEVRIFFKKALPPKIFAHHRERKGRRRQTKESQTRSLHISLEDVKISVLKKGEKKRKIKGSTLNGERRLKCRHRSVLEKRTSDEGYLQQTLVSLQSP